MSPPSHPADNVQPNATEAARIERIQRVIRQRGDELRATYPLLRHNNLLGMAIFVVAVSGIALCAGAYWLGNLSAWVCIPLVAIFTSLLHELEHDLIHWQYFKNRKWVHHMMLFCIWALRPGTINPWIRRKLHFLHHKTSGTEADLEERGIGNGQPYGWLRLWVMLDTFVGNLVRIAVMVPKGHRGKSLRRVLRSYFPFGWICALLAYGFLAFHAVDGLASLLGHPLVWSASTRAVQAAVTDVMVVLIAPFYLRSFCLNFISSNMHYYGGVNSLLQQTQILNAWYLWPLQLFCFNFGSTHGIHHFVVGEPFYIRQLTAKAAHRVMLENGVRHNDVGTFRRANRYQPG